MRKREQGVTLVEMLIVVLIVGILASMGIPQYYKFLRTQALQGDVLELASIFRTAVRLALAHRNDVSCKIDVDNNTVMMRYADMSGATAEARYNGGTTAGNGVSCEDTVELAGFTSGGTTYTTGYTFWEFRYRGTSQISSSLHICDENDIGDYTNGNNAARGEFYTITVQGVSGRAAVYDCGRNGYFCADGCDQAC